MAYVLGFFTADGNMIRNKRGGCYLEFTTTDRDVLEKIKKLLAVNNKISAIKRTLNSKICHRIQIGSKEMFNDLIRLGMTPAKSNSIQLPNIPDKYFPDFVRGYFDGDGCVYFKENWAKDRDKPRWVFQVRFTSGSKDFLRSLWQLLKATEVCKGGYLYNKSRGFELVFSHHDGLDLSKFMYYNISSDLYLERKYSIFQKVFKTLHWTGRSIG